MEEVYRKQPDRALLVLRENLELPRVNLAVQTLRKLIA